MDILIILVAFILMVLGVLGSFLPILPGPLTSWLGFLILHFADGFTLSNTFLIITLFVAVAIYILDYIIPALGTKRFGGSRSGMVGTTVGLIFGLLSPIPFGIIIGPFIGAFVGEIIHKNNINQALKAAFGSFLGFITSTFLKFLVAVIFFGFFLVKLSEYNRVWY